MKDTQDEIFKAFIVALVQQTEPLPAAVQYECNKIGETFTTIDIARLAELHPSLLASYEEADIWLANHSNERNKGLDILPNAESENNNTTNTETDNTASDIRDLPDLPKILNQIEAKVQPRGLREFLIKILQAGDSVQASRDRILVSIADGFVHE
jgi:hypothetical protein